jgi:Rrf2 family protein
MITKTSLLATRALLYLASDQRGIAISPRSVAAQLGESQAYLSKVLRALVKGGILRAEHGSKGGVLLNRRPSEITLLSIMEACQAPLFDSYCHDIDDLRTTCAFHRAAVDLRQAIVAVLSRWNLEQLAKSPGRTQRLPGEKHCVMTTLPSFYRRANVRLPGRKRHAMD